MAIAATDPEGQQDRHANQIMQIAKEYVELDEKGLAQLGRHPAKSPVF